MLTKCHLTCGVFLIVTITLTPRLVLAQAGSTGGTIGKTDKVDFGGHDRATTPQDQRASAYGHQSKGTARQIRLSRRGGSMEQLGVLRVWHVRYDLQ
jgi:hypothetical protein